MQARFLILILALMPAILQANICSINQFDKTRNRMIPVKVCCKGYKNVNRHRLSCEPICNVSCGRNGTCISPYTCRCDQGYENQEHLPSRPCVPVCIGCTNGECIAPNTCHCDAGHQRNEFTGHCDPVCPTGCPNGDCVSPGNCSCHLGYSQSEADQSCTPICTDACAQNTFCLAPNTCSESKPTPYSEYFDDVTIKSLIAFVKLWMIEILVGILILVALISLVWFVTCRAHRRHYRVAECEKDNPLDEWTYTVEPNTESLL